MGFARSAAAAGAFAIAFGVAGPASGLVLNPAPEEITSVILGGFGASASRATRPEDARQNAVDACVDRNEHWPAGAVEAVADGMGDWLVWVRDRDGDLWSCNADAAGLVYANVLIGGDLLEGRGPEFLPAQPSLAGSAGEQDAETRARDLCVGVAGLTQDVSVLAAVSDGLGDTLVWLRSADGQLWMCDASGAAELFVFEPVGFPIEGDDAPALPAEAPAS